MYHLVELVYDTPMYNSRPVVQVLMMAEVADLITKVMYMSCIYFVNNRTFFCCFKGEMRTRAAGAFKLLTTNV